MCIRDSFNAIRAHAALERVRASRALGRAADFHTRDMLKANFFAHPSSNGQSMFARVASFASAKLLGEVIAYLGGGSGAAGPVVRMWMHSAPHRAMILTPRFRRVGIARRTGSLGGAKVTVFTADFASSR